MDEPAAPPPDRARRHFHWALGLGLIPCAGLVVTMGLALVNNHPGSPEHERWRRRLQFLALLDVALLALLIVIGRHAGDRTPPAPAPDPAATVRIGISFPTTEPSGEARVAAVHRGWAAERAGLRRGDLVVAVDGTPVATQEELRQSIQSKDWGAPRVLTVQRDGKPLAIVVTPERPRNPRDLGLFEAVPGPIDWGRLLRTPWDWAAIFAIAVVAGFRGRRSRGGVRVWLGFFLAIALSTGLTIGVALVMHRIQGGFSKGTMLVAMSAQVAGLLAGAALAARWIPRPASSPEEPPPLAWWKTSLVAIYYLVTGMVRLSVILIAVDRLLLGGDSLGATQPIRDLAQAGLGTAGTLFLLADVVLLGPIAEEAVFRGFLVPRLRDRIGPAWAIVVSALTFALLHPHYRLGMVVIAYVGMILAWARLRSRGMDAPIVLHVAFNALASMHLVLGTP